MPNFLGVATDSPIFQNINLTGLLFESASGGLTATAGGGQTNALQLTSEVNRITTVASAGDSIKLPAAQAGLTIIVIQRGSNPMQVFGLGTDTIDGQAAATGVSQMQNSMVIYTCVTAGIWETEGLATGFGGPGLQTFSWANSVSAAGSTQATATPLAAMQNNVTTVASGTGVNLPSSAAGLEIVVINNGANALQVYPAQGASDTINGIAANQGISILPGTTAQFNCTAAGAWTVQPASTKYAAFNINSATSSTTLTATNISGGVATVDLLLNGALAAAANAQLPTVAALIAALHAPAVGTSYRLRILNTSSGAFAWTVTTNTGWTLNGSMLVNNLIFVDFVITLTSLTTATIQRVGSGTAP